jgi:hypothetical protein
MRAQRNIAIALAAGLLLLGFLLSGVTATPVVQRTDGIGWGVHETSSDASAGVVLQAAAGANIRHVITGLTLSTVSAINVKVYNSSSPPEAGDLNSIIAGPYYFTASGPGTVSVKFPRPIEGTADKAVAYVASGAGALSLQIQGYPKTAP